MWKSKNGKDLNDAVEGCIHYIDLAHGNSELVAKHVYFILYKNHSFNIFTIHRFESIQVFVAYLK